MKLNSNQNSNATILMCQIRKVINQNVLSIFLLILHLVINPTSDISSFPLELKHTYLKDSITHSLFPYIKTFIEQKIINFQIIHLNTILCNFMYCLL